MRIDAHEVAPGLRLKKRAKPRSGLSEYQISNKRWWVYHGTNLQAFWRIKREGLQVAELNPEDMEETGYVEGVYFTSSDRDALRHGDIVLRFLTPADSKAAYKNDEYVTAQAVAPEDIQIFWRGAWRWLK